MTGIRRRLTLFLFGVVVCFNLATSANQQFSYLAESFLQGKTYFLSLPNVGLDTVLFNGKYYWPLGPFPALLLLPLVFIFRLFHLFFFQGYLQVFLFAGVFYSFFRIARRLDYSRDDAEFLALAFCCASAFLGVGMYAVSWAFAQVVAVLLLALALLEYLGRRRLWIIGTLMALASVTRFTAGLNVVFFLMVVFLENNTVRAKLSAGFSLVMPMLIALAALALYNDARFGNWMEQGYALQSLAGVGARAREAHGIMSLAHVPGNLFYFLLAGPVPITFYDGSQVLKFPYVKANLWGMSIFLTSPYFFYLFRIKYDDLISKLLLFSSAIVATPIFLYYGIGLGFGYRYSLDFLPFLFFLLIRNYRKDHSQLSPGFKKTILVAAVTNCYFVLTIFL
jgi:hypothetical protein